MTKSALLLNTAVKYFAGIILVGLMLFWPAGTLAYGGGWLFMALLFIPMFVLGVVLFFKAPELLEKRLNTKEKLTVQKGVVAVSALLFIFGFVFAGLDFRFGWTKLPLWLSAAAAVVLLLSYAMYAEVMRENAWLSRSVEVQDGQQVVDTGLYGVVRHPMYLAVSLLFLSIPLVLGSLIALIIFLPFPVVLVFRIKSEEQLLLKDLPGYGAYLQKVKYRMIPFIW